MLRQTAEFLDDPSLFTIETRELSEYETYDPRQEHIQALYELERLALEHGCKSDIWRRLRNVADQMGLDDDAERFEKLFHDALAKGV